MNLLLPQRYLPVGKTYFVNFISSSRKLLTSILFLVMLSFQTFAQDDTWTLLKEENGVKVYYQITPCDSEQSDDPLEMLEGDSDHETFRLRIVNDNGESKSITFSKVTKTDDSDELETITISSGTTLLETCEAAPKMILTQTESDQYPISVTDFVAAFQITIND